MGIPGLLKEIGKGERVALAKLAFDHLEKTKRPLRIAIDAAIWNFQHQSAQGGKNPELRTLFFRLLRLLALPIHPVFVYDGKNKPLTKRGRTVSRYGTCVPNEHSKSLVSRFQFPHHTAPGEAEAECATLQKHGIVDAVMSQDVDAIMFGSTLTLRDWSKEGVKGNKSPTHVSVLDSAKIKASLGLDEAGMILVAMLSGGDYHEGIPGFGSTLSCSAAKAGFGAELIDLVLNDNEEGLREWRQRLQYELGTNESGYFSKKNRTIQIPDEFPDRKVLNYYLKPAVTKPEDLKKLESKWIDWWAKEININELRQYTSITFDWMYRGGAKKYIRCLAQPLFQHRLKIQKVDGAEFSCRNITERRQHFVSDGIPELRFSMIPAEVVDIDLDAEEENPDNADFEADDGQDEVEELEGNSNDADSIEAAQPSNAQKRRKRPLWQPDIIEKWWIPEALLKMGLSGVVAEWHEEQKAMRSDPVKFATRKCRPAHSSKQIDANMRHGAMKHYLAVRKTGKVKDIQQPKVPTEKQSKTPKVCTTSDTDNTANLSTSVEPTKNVLENEVPTEASASLLRSPKTISHTITSSPTSPKRSRSETCSQQKTVADDIDVLPASVSQRRRHVLQSQKTVMAPSRDDDEVVFISESKAPRSIESFFGARTYRAPKTNAQPSDMIPSLGSSVLNDVGKMPMPIAQAVFEEAQYGSVTEKTALRKKMAVVSRDSLPGVWREVSSTPRQKSRVSLVDLTND